MKQLQTITTIDTHTAGGPTRIITSGMPALTGDSVAAKMADFQANHDHLRKLLMHEPRGHANMWGAVLVEPSHPDAVVGTFFMNAGGYLPACVHSAIGVATAGLQEGFIPRPAAGDSVIMEIPAGLVELMPKYEGDELQSIAIRTAPAFVHTAATEVTLPGGQNVSASIVFSGVFFALVDINQLDLPAVAGEPSIGTHNADGFATLGVELLAALNQSVAVSHPLNPAANAIALIMFYDEQGDYDARDIVIGPTGGIDRSPCGAGTGAKIAQLQAAGRLAVGEPYQLESFIGTQFTATVDTLSSVGEYPAIVPEISGAAYITGKHEFVLDSRDPLEQGFLI